MTPEIIREWADFKITERASDNVFFELSIAQTTNKIIELLHERVVWNYNDIEIRNYILGYYKEYLNSNQNNWFQVEEELLEYFKLLEYADSNESVEDFLYYLDDDWNLRKNGYEGPLPMPKFLTDNLIKYNDYHKLKELLTREKLTGYVI